MSTPPNPAATLAPSASISSSTPSTTPKVLTSVNASSRLHDIAFLKNDGSNFATWSFRVGRVLRQRGLWKIVEGTEKRPDAGANASDLAEWLERDELAYTQITLTLEDEPLNGVMHLSTSKEAWDKLSAMYEGKGQQTVASLIGELFRETLSDDIPLRPQLDAMLHKKHVLTSLGQSLDDSLIAIAMVISLPPSYSTLRAILMSSDVSLSTDKVISSVVEHEKMLASQQKHTVLLARTMSKTQARSDSKSTASGKPPPAKLNHFSENLCQIHKMLAFLQVLQIGLVV